MTFVQSYTDEQLVEGLKKGNRKMFTAIYNQFFDALFIHVRRRVGNREDARDIVQELFLSLWKNRSTLLPDTDLPAYLYTAAKYKVINHLVHNKNKEKLKYMTKTERY